MAEYFVQVISGFGYKEPESAINISDASTKPALPPYYNGSVKSFKYEFVSTDLRSAGIPASVNLIDADTAVFCPPDVQKSILRQGWNPASAYVAQWASFQGGSGLSWEYDYLPLSMGLDKLAETIVIIWALHFQEPGYPVHVPYYRYGTPNKPAKIAGNKIYKYNDALAFIGGMQLKELAASDLMAAASKVGYKNDNHEIGCLQGFAELDKSALSNKIIYHISPEQITSNWDFFKTRTTDHMTDYKNGKWENPPIPPGSWIFSVNGTNVNLRSSPDTNKPPVGVVNTGDKLIQITGPINDFWYVLHNGTYCYISDSYVDAHVPKFPPLSYTGMNISAPEANQPAQNQTNNANTPIAPVSNQNTSTETVPGTTTNITNITNTDQPVAKSTTQTPTAKDNTLLYAGVAAGVLILGTVLILALKSKSSPRNEEYEQELEDREREMESA